MIEFAQRVSTDNIIPLRDVPPPAVPLAMLDLQFGGGRGHCGDNRKGGGGAANA